MAEDTRDKRDPQAVGELVIGELNRTSKNRKRRKKATTVNLDAFQIRNYGESDDEFEKRVAESHAS